MSRSSSKDPAESKVSISVQLHGLLACTDAAAKDAAAHSCMHAAQRTSEGGAALQSPEPATRPLPRPSAASPADCFRSASGPARLATCCPSRSHEPLTMRGQSSFLCWNSFGTRVRSKRTSLPLGCLPAGVPSHSRPQVTRCRRNAFLLESSPRGDLATVVTWCKARPASSMQSGGGVWTRDGVLGEAAFRRVAFLPLPASKPATRLSAPRTSAVSRVPRSIHRSNSALRLGLSLDAGLARSVEWWSSGSTLHGLPS